jgi:RNA polymerase sigma-70 factor (ECF subfamily)
MPRKSLQTPAMEASPSLPAMMAAPSGDLSAWFDREVRPHESALRAYLRARFPALGDHEDIVQESYIRLLRARESGQLRSAKSLLFTIARNYALDVFRERHGALESSLANFDEVSVSEQDANSSAESISHERKLQLLEEALQRLPERCRQVILLKRFEGLSYDEIAVRLGISHNTISAHITAGVTKCRDYLLAHGVTKGRRETD